MSPPQQNSTNHPRLNSWNGSGSANLSAPLIAAAQSPAVNNTKDQVPALSAGTQPSHSAQLHAAGDSIPNTSSLSPAVSKTSLAEKCGVCRLQQATIWCEQCSLNYCTNCDPDFHQQPSEKLHKKLKIQRR